MRIRAAGLNEGGDGVARNIEVYHPAGCCPRACGWFCPFLENALVLLALPGLLSEEHRAEIAEATRDGCLLHEVDFVPVMGLWRDGQQQAV